MSCRPFYKIATSIQNCGLHPNTGHPFQHPNVCISKIKCLSHIPQFRERKNRIVNMQNQAGEEPADEELAVPEPGFASGNHCGCARDQCPQNSGKSSASWGGWSVC